MLHQRIVYFLEAAEAGSFSGAARKLYISPQALTKQIDLLEEELGGRLFVRSRQGVSLTPLGSYAKERFRKAEAELKDAVVSIKNRASDSRPRLRLGIFSAMPQDAIVTPVLSFLMAVYPQYQLEINLLDLHEGRHQMLEHKLDLMLTNAHAQEDWGDCGCLVFGSYQAEIMVSLRHPWAVREEITPEDMRKFPCLKMNKNGGPYLVPVEESFFANIPCKETIEVNNFDTMCALLQQGKAFGVFPRAFLGMERAKIKAFPYPGQALYFYSALIYWPGNELQGYEALIRDLREEFELQLR